MKKKKCSKCGEVKDVKEFYKHKSRKDKLCSYCKACISEYGKRRSTKNIELRNDSDFKRVTEKKCSKCGKIKDVNEFHKGGCNVDGLQPQCKLCKKEQYNKNKETISLYTKQYYKTNKKKISERGKKHYRKNWHKINKRHSEYREANKEVMAEYDKVYYRNNKERITKRVKSYVKKNRHKVSERCKQRYENNKERIVEQRKQHYEDNKELIDVRRKQYRYSNAKYELFYKKLTVDESPLLHADGISLEVLCKYCGKYFIPCSSDTNKRIGALNGNVGGDQYLYCSENCKQACPVYRQKLYPKGFKQKNGEITENSGHEGNEIWKQEVIKRNIEEHGQLQCEICGNTNENELSTHHEKPRKTHPEMSLDPDNGWVLCSFGKGNNCHLKYGHPKGTNCSTAELAKLVCGEKQKNVV